MFSQVSLSRVRARMGVAVVSVVSVLAAGAGLSAAASVPPPPPFSACYWSAGSGPPPFSDVPADSWFADDVRCLAELGVTTGTSPSTFSPDDDVTRAQMALFLARLADVTGVEPAVSTHPFKDLDHVSDEVRDAVAVIYGLGVTTGTSPSTFSPDDAVTRAQMALFLSRFASVGSELAVPGVHPFKDLDHVSDEVRDAVAVIYGLGVTTGTSPSTFSPDDAVTRAQMAGFVARVYRVTQYAYAADQPAPTGVSAVAYRSADPAEAFTAAVSWDPVDESRFTPTRFEVQVYDPADPSVLWPAAGVCLPGNTQPSSVATLLADSSPVETGELSAGGDVSVVRVRTVAAVTGSTVDGSTVDGPPVCSEWVKAPLEFLTVPGPVSGVAVEVGNESLLVSWLPPADDTVDPVSGYRVAWRGGRDAPSSVFVAVADLIDPAVPSYRISDLVNGRGYTVSVAAVNKAGDGAAVTAVPSASSGANSWVPAVTAAAAPQTLVVVPDFDDGSVLVSWVAPTDTGGSELQSFTVEYRCGDVSSWSAAAGSPVAFVSTVQAQSLRVSGLPQGETCEFRVAAVSSIPGESDVTSGFATAVTLVVEPPDAPTAVTVVAEPPDAPTAVTVQPAHESLLVSWLPPADDTVDPVSGYRVAWRGGRDAPSSVFVAVADLIDPAVPSYRISDLVNGRGYTVSVAAVNKAGDGAAVTAVPSASSGANSWVPAVTAAAAPQTLVVVPDFDDGSVLVSWVAPTDTGGSELQSFTVEYRCGDVSSWSAAAGSPVAFVSTVQAQSLRVSGLPQGETCEFRVAAVSSIPGESDVTSGFATAVTLVVEPPDAPTAVTVQPAHESLLVSWLPPADDGGSPVTGFKVFYASGDDPEVVLVPDAETSVVVSGLLNRYVYTVSVSAVSDAGESPRSAVSAPVQPTSVPSAPLYVIASPPPVLVGAGAEPHDGSALVVSWGMPLPNGTEPVTGFSLQYRIAAVPESAEDAGDDSPAGAWSSPVSVDLPMLTYTFTGLTQGTAYDVRVAAVNDSDLSTPGVQPQSGLYGYADPATPATFPGVVSDVDVESGFRLLTVSWSPPAVTGGAEITHYWVRHTLNRLGTEPFSNPGLRVDASELRVVLTDLEQDAPYVVYVFAVNSMGDGTHVHSTTGDFPGSTTLGVPSAPESVTAKSMKAVTGGLLLVSWTEVVDSNGGGPIAGYRVESRTGVSGLWMPVDSDVDLPGQQDFVKETRSAEVSASVGAEVTVRVRAVTTVGRVGSSGYAPSVTVLAVPAAPLSVSVSVVEDLQGVVDVSWTHAAQSDKSLTVSGYLVEWFPVDPASMRSRGQRVVSGAVADSFRIEGLLPQVVDAAAGVYTIRVAAVNTVGESLVVVASESVTVDPPTSS